MRNSFLTRDERILGGALIIKGTRLPAALLFQMIADGMTTKDIQKIYPYLSDSKIRLSILQAAHKLDKCVC